MNTRLSSYTQLYTGHTFATHNILHKTNKHKFMTHSTLKYPQKSTGSEEGKRLNTKFPGSLCLPAMCGMQREAKKEYIKMFHSSVTWKFSCYLSLWWFYLFYFPTHSARVDEGAACRNFEITLYPIIVCTSTYVV